MLVWDHHHPITLYDIITLLPGNFLTPTIVFPLSSIYAKEIASDKRRFDDGANFSYKGVYCTFWDYGQKEQTVKKGHVVI